MHIPRFIIFHTFASINYLNTVYIDFFYNRLSFIVLVVFLAALLIQLLYHWSMFSRVAFYKRKYPIKNESELEPVSIVLCARDAYEYLVDLVPALLKQDYPDFELVIVNDCSDDETEEYLKDLERKEQRVKPVQLRQHLNFFNGKKFPLSMGIKSATHDLIVLADCNCMPVNDLWLRSVVDCYHKKTEIVIGYSPFERKKGLLNQLIRFDALQQGLHYLSAALCGHPYKGIGANLSYRKELFFRNKGFISHYTTSVGEDDLFISQVARKKNTEVLINAEDAILTAPTRSFKLWMRQKSARYSTIPKYNLRARFSLSLFAWSHTLFYAAFIALLLMQPAFVLSIGAAYYIPVLAFFFLLRFGSQMFIYFKASKRLGEKGLIAGLLAYDFMFALLTPLLRLMGRMKIGVE